MTGRRRTLLAVGIVAALAHSATGDPAPEGDAPSSNDAPGFWHIQSRSHLTTDGGSKLDLPPAYVLDEPTYDKLDLALKQAQQDATRYKAESDSYAKSVSGWQPGWKTLASALALGVGLGWYVHGKF